MSSLPQRPDKTIDVSTAILIRCPRDEVAKFAADPDNAPKWYLNIKSVEWKTAKALAPGARIGFQAQFLRRKLAYDYEIVEFVPGERLVMRTDRPFLMETTYTWESIDEHSTRMTLRNRGNPTGFSKLFRPILPFAIKLANRKDLQRLKTILEQ